MALEDADPMHASDALGVGPSVRIQTEALARPVTDDGAGKVTVDRTHHDDRYAVHTRGSGQIAVRKSD